MQKNMACVKSFLYISYYINMIINRLSEIMGRQRIKMSELGKMTGLGRGTIHVLYHDKSKGIDFQTLDKICIALECTPNDILEFTKE